MGANDLKKFVPLSEDTRSVLVQAGEKHSLSARSFHRIIKIARTIADLFGDTEVDARHVNEALSYRPKKDIVR
jgi:magnesium chelatase family protein